MALIKCSKCKKSISNTVKNCIHCGEPTKRKKEKLNTKQLKLPTFKIRFNKLFVLFLGLIIIIIGTILIFLNFDFNKDEISNNKDNNNNFENNSNNNSLNHDVNDEILNDNTDVNDNNISDIINSTKYYTCPEGYSLEDNNNCVKKEFADSIIEYTCPESFVKKGSFCENTIKIEPINGQCTGDFTLNNNQCEQTVQYPAEVESISCPTNYSKYSGNDTLCYKVNTTTAKTNYSCPSGYSLNKENKCER